VFIVVPKNSGLQGYNELVEINKNSQILKVRGEDVPFWVEKLLQNKSDVIGITGQDLYYEYNLENYKTNTKIINLIIWDDNQALFNKPTLCLIGPKNRSLENLPKNLKICISSKYKNIAKKYLNLLETRGYVFEKFYVKGSVEESFLMGLSDIVIDIVYTGKSMNELGLTVYDKIFYSNFVIIGGKK
jgi:ATP phosphoribosyltransferase